MPSPEIVKMPTILSSYCAAQCYVVPTPWKVDSLENREAHASHVEQSPGVEASVKVAKRRITGRSVAESLDGRRSEGYEPHTIGVPLISATDLANLQ